MNYHEKLEKDSAISIELPKVKSGERTSVSYNGLLSNKGADKVYLHYGFDGWKNPETATMHRSSHGCFTTEIDVKGNKEVNFCFKDSANNWDNNNGTNWTVEINP